MDILANGDFFPSAPNITSLLSEWDLKHVYSTEDVRRSINFILERSAILEDALDVEVTEVEFFASTPDLSTLVKVPALFIATARHLATLALAFCLDKVSSSPIVISGFADTLGKVELKTTAGSGAVLELHDEVAFPVSSKATVLFADKVEDVASNVGAKNLWDGAKTPEQLHFALMTEAAGLLRTKGLACKPENVPKFTIGSDFFDTARRYGALGADGPNSDLLRETCARVVINDPKYPIGELKRPNKVGKLMPIVRKDGAVACRTHVQKSHAALRLMFWRHNDGTVELANVGPKQELEIFNGASAATEQHECWIQKEE
ncbi:hypothetical protein [Bradyrhizobium sp. NBAIM16]|uniref:hypothetical protein n=1 Tax=Bradyrhizobium sp. NBAIM16 TaxID=2793813 RepID=UPI001CD3698A|nr:hypothetical protein [Bradyrhizobium sp. NBAIM16]